MAMGMLEGNKKNYTYVCILKYVFSIKDYS